MRRSVRLALALLILAACSGGDWLHFRGTDNRSVSDEESLPKTFDEQANVAWKVPLPGRGPSSPIVVAGRVVVTCSSGPWQDRLHVLALDAASGNLQWERQLWATGSSICQVPVSAFISSSGEGDQTRSPTLICTPCGVGR